MKIILFTMIFLIFFTITSYAQCIVPGSNMEIKNDVAFCQGNYNIDGNIKINSDNIIIDCNNTNIIGNSLGNGFYLNERNNVEIRNCNIENFEVGIYLEKSNNNLIENNNLKNNKFAIGLLSSGNNNIENNDFEDNINNIFVYTINKTETVEAEEKALEETLPTEKEILIQSIRIKNPDVSQGQIEEQVNDIFNRYFTLTQGNLIISRTFEFVPEENITIVRLFLTPKKTLVNVSLYEYIPKCFSKLLDNIVFSNKDFEILSKDPLIAWSFPFLAEQTSISYQTKNIITDACKELFKTFGIAKEFEAEKPSIVNMIISVIVIILTVVLIIYFIRFKPEKL